MTQTPCPHCGDTTGSHSGTHCSNCGRLSVAPVADVRHPPEMLDPEELVLAAEAIDAVEDSLPELDVDATSRLDTSPDPIETLELADETPTGKPSRPKLTGTVTVGETVEFPYVCALCGLKARKFTCLTTTAAPASMLKLFGLLASGLVGALGGFIGGLIAQDANYKRPISLSLPLCGDHNDDRRVKWIRMTFAGPREVRISGVHPKFVAAINKSSQKMWDEFERQMNGA